MFKLKKSQTQQEPIWVDGQIAVEQDEALFAALDNAKKKKKRKLIYTILIAVVSLAVILAIGVGVMQRKVRQQFMPERDEVLSAEAYRGSISTVVTGSGMILNVDAETVSVPTGVEITEILVKYNDTVEEGQLLAAADMATVRSAMSDLQAEIDDLDDQITAAEGDTVSSYVTAGVPGRVKILYGEKDRLVEDVMVDNGALAVLSLDGYMAVDIETAVLTEGDAVTVVLADGTETHGNVKAVVGNKATVLLTDDGPAWDDEVSVLAESGERVGTGRLYIHNPLKVTGYAGTIHHVNVKLNQKVYASTTIFTLTDTATKASYDALLRSRSEKEETLLDLLVIQRYGGIVSPISGSVYSVTGLDDESEEEITEIATISPDVSMSVTISVDESDILSLELGQSAGITIRSVGDKTFMGTVTEIDKTDSGGEYTAVITMDKAEGMLPGMTASVSVRIEGVDDVILVPYEALHQTSSGYYVYTTYDEDTQEYGGKVDVIPGLSNSDYVEIKSGLSEGDTVWYTEAEDFFSSMGFGNMGFGGMPSGGGMPNFGSGNMPSGMPSGGSMPNFGGGMPSGMPSVGSRPSGMPGGFGG